MKKIWKKKSPQEIKSRVFKALDQNVNFHQQTILGIPASYLDDKVFSDEASFIKDSPFLNTLVQNPNHIGCHTVNESESYYKGTQEIEQELIDICAVDILNGTPGEMDGYVASGGTEANIQAIWIYRNYFISKYQANRKEICLLCSGDTHYSIDKAANLLCLDVTKVPVNEDNREISLSGVESAIDIAVGRGKKYFIVIANMMTTMYGSIDDIDIYIKTLESRSVTFKIHVDGAYGGFYYPFSQQKNSLDFINPNVTSITLDAHKMAQAPYGTGIFLIRKNYIQYANTKEASYVRGEDYTLIGSRSGANVVAVWMILVKNGPYGWIEKIFVLQKRTDWICDELRNLGIQFFRHPKSNIIALKSEYVSKDIVLEYGLVPDNYTQPNWYKIVVMEHATIELLSPLIEKLGKMTIS